ncbi:hypothetical protein CUT44_01935 [Streptomyces carminius]|uniref:Low molecular weight antigen MTB12-like C-terminal domain-containing protein n=1 Tax=Streptomyces carminius TaxID=2665496 RepID=A0A2M8M1G0_9ACTN|nr:hypothetical protein [Streptomyces carminius]PJE98026.1 hypothetical protein CUT44_10195 [Streptomyces carminius]PJF01852.1 hypothetical protein CUT44_01935 [Streptomyces carminius]
MASVVRQRTAVLAALTALLAAAACGGGGGEEPSPAPSPSSSATAPSRPAGDPPGGVPSPSSSPSASPSPSATATAPEDPAGAAQEIRENWEGFFTATSVDDRAALVEDGELYRLMIEGFTRDERAELLRVRVDRTVFTSPERARVGYTLIREGSPVATGATGTAVRQEGTWKISFTTLCSLTRHGDDVPQAATCPSSSAPPPAAP